MSYRVEISRRAKNDIDEILNWLGTRSSEGALAWADRWDEIVEKLADSAHRCPIARESAQHEVDLRQIVFKTRRGLPYRAIFFVDNGTTVVLTVRGPGQDFIDLDDIV